jgi:GTPase SAR1 family protein
MKYIHYLGVPGCGKTTLMWSKIRSLREVEQDEQIKEGKLVYHKFPEQKTIVIGIYEEGRVFSGTDALSKAVGPEFRSWVTANKETLSGWALFSEGERFSNNPTLEHLFENTDMELILLSVDQEEIDRRRAARNNTQDPKWMKGMETRIRNLCKKFPHTVVHNE